MESEAKFCEDCHFYRASNASSDEDRCAKDRPLTGRGLVRRAPLPLRFCAAERTHSDADSCGFDAKWFEPKGPEAR